MNHRHYPWATHYPWTTHIIHEPRTLPINHTHYPWTTHIIHEPQTLSMNHRHYPWTMHIIHEPHTLSMNHTHYPWTTHIIHEFNHLQNELVLSQVVAVFEDGDVLTSLCRAEGQTTRHQLALKKHTISLSNHGNSQYKPLNDRTYSKLLNDINDHWQVRVNWWTTITINGRWHKDRQKLQQSVWPWEQR